MLNLSYKSFWIAAGNVADERVILSLAISSSDNLRLGIEIGLKLGLALALALGSVLIAGLILHSEHPQSLFHHI